MSEAEEQSAPVSKQKARERIREIYRGWINDAVPHRAKMVSYYSKSYEEDKYVFYLYDKFSSEEVHFHFCDQFPFFTYINEEIVQSQADEVTVIDHELTQSFKEAVKQNYPDAYDSPASNLKIDWSAGGAQT